VHTESGRRALARVQSGAVAPPSRIAAVVSAAAEASAQHGSTDEQAGVARAYEQEIGALSPAVADALQRALEEYPAPWIADAIRLAAERNARSWRYVAGILRRWQAEGRDHAASGRSADDATPDPYSRVVRHSWP
jgi:DnaD/phage-associated family protein